MSNGLLINNFYNAFASLESDGMNNCYHPQAVFTDPAFGELHDEQLFAMWRMLIARSDGNLIVTHANVIAEGNHGSAEWTARYNFKQTGRTIVNRVTASFEFENGKIIRHTDQFDLWHWARQALGWKGWALGWTPFFKSQLRNQTQAMLASYMEKQAK